MKTGGKTPAAGLERSSNILTGSCGCEWQSYAIKATRTERFTVGMCFLCPKCSKPTTVTAIDQLDRTSLF